MQHFTQVIDGIDGSRAELVGYVIETARRWTRTGAGRRS